MPTSAVDICNKALKKNHQFETISALTGNTTKAGKLCEEFYDDARREVLRLAQWTCLIARAPLTEALDDDEAPIDHYTGRLYAFDLPTDFISRIGATDESGNPVDLLIEGNHAFSDYETTIMVYVKNSEDPAEWDNLLAEAVTMQLSSKLAYPLTGSHENEIAFAQAAMALAVQSEKKSRRERRTGPNPSDQWMPGLFPTRYRQ